MSPIPASEERIPGWIVGAFAFLFSFAAIGALALPVAVVFRLVFGDLRVVCLLLVSGLVSAAIYLGWAKGRGHFNMMLRVIATAWFSSVVLYWLFALPSLLKTIQAGRLHVLPVSLILPIHLVPVLGGVVAAILVLAALKLYEFWHQSSGA